MIPSPHPSLRFLPALLPALLVAAAPPATAQRPDGRSDGRVLEAGVRAGLDYRQDAFLLGGQLRVPVDPWHRLELVPGIDFTFLDGLTERQVNLDGAFNLDSEGLLYVGAGAALRNTRYRDDEGNPLERETRTGYSIFGGLRTGPPSGSIVAHIELRWVVVDQFEPRTVTVGLNYPVPLGF